MYPSDLFFLKALFLSGFRQVSPGCGPFQLKGCVGKEPVVCLTHLAMNFSNAGTTEPAGDAFRAHVTWYDKGVKRNRNIRGPRRPDEEAAQKDLESIRAVASGMGREDGFAAMATEAKRLCDSKTPKGQGSVTPFGEGCYRRHSVAAGTIALPFRD